MLQDRGYPVVSSGDGIQAIELYTRALQAQKPFDVVILGLTVRSGMVGKETITAQLQIDGDVKTIVSSGYSGDPVMANFREHGFKDVILKPYKAATLHGMIQRLKRLPA